MVEEQIEAELELGRHAEVVPQLERNARGIGLLCDQCDLAQRTSPTDGDTSWWN